MTNLIIIGNGFDMAHGLNTSYTSFIEHMIDVKKNDEIEYSDLFQFTDIVGDISTEDMLRDKDSIFSNNQLFDTLYKKFVTLNWCDIEDEYFNKLNRINSSDNIRYSNANRLNSDFEIIKEHLSGYLKVEQDKFKELDVYIKYFNAISTEKTMVLNFNYTNTVFNYLKNRPNIELVQIHGELESEDNPIIFGYAANDIESRKLIQFKDKEFMRNIKKHNYKRANEETKLIRFLEMNKDIEVSIIGHSCGLSDKLILNQIFNSDKVSKIRIFYHKNYEHYFETQVNIDRIMDNDDNFRKLINFQDSMLIPQKKNIADYDIFIEKVLSIVEKRKAPVKPML